MKSFENVGIHKLKTLGFLSLAICFFLMAGCNKSPFNPVPKVTTVASGLVAPMGLATDWRGNVWIAETGTANNDGKVVVVRPKNGGHNGQAAQAVDAIINLSSIKNALSQEVEGPAHLLFDHSTLYILAGDLLYHVDLKSYKPGDAPIDASTLQSEDIGSYVRSLSPNIVTPNDSHPYNMIKGPDGLLYIVDAGSNAIIKRMSAGHYSVFATFPNIKDATQGDPSVIQSVPTGIIFERGYFLVSTLTGFPFLKGNSVIYKVTMKGDVSVYRKGFTTLVDIAEGNYNGNVVLHHGDFSLPAGFAPNTGSLLFTNGNSTVTIADKLNMPAGLEQINNQSWYVTSLADGTLLRIYYEMHR